MKYYSFLLGSSSLLLGLILLESIFVGCGMRHDQRHAAVGRWEARGDNVEVLHIFPDGTASLNARRCTWLAIDADSVKTDCERPFTKNRIRVFTIRKRDGVPEGELEFYEELVFRKVD